MKSKKLEKRIHNLDEGSDLKDCLIWLLEKIKRQQAEIRNLQLKVFKGEPDTE